MTSIDDLRAADTLKVSGIAYQLNLPLGQGARKGVAANFCLTKPVGQLSFTLTSAELNLPVQGLSIPFSGAPNPDGSVTWTTDTPLVGVSYQGYSITRIHGTLLTSVAAGQPTIDESCNSVVRLFRTSLMTSGSAPTLYIDVDVLGITQTASAVVTFAATVGEEVPQTYFEVGVWANHWQGDGCGNLLQLVTGQNTPSGPAPSIQLTALVDNLQATGNVASTSYSWTIASGPAHIAGPTDGSAAEVILDAEGTVVVSVTVSIATDLDSAGTATGRIRFSVVTAEELGFLRLACRLKAEHQMINLVVAGIGSGFTVGHFHVVDPLYDPPKGELVGAGRIVGRPFSSHEMTQIRGALERVIGISTEALQRADQIIGIRGAIGR